MPDSIKAKNPATDLTYRSLSVRMTNGKPTSLNESERSVEAIIASENPTSVFDFSRYEIVNEVLIIAGVQLPSTRQIPLLDSHQRYSTASVIGSVRNLRSQNGFLLGDAHFSSTPETDPIWTKVREGHLTDFSAGYKSLDSQWVAEGEKYSYRGVTYEGPLLVTKKWEIREGSVVPIGADELSKARSAANNLNQNNTEGKKTMPEKEVFSKEEVIIKERERVAEISAMVHRYGMPLDLMTGWIDAGTSVADCKIAISERVLARELAKPMPGHMPAGGPQARAGVFESAYITADASEKRLEASSDGLVMRAGIELKNPSPGALEYRGQSLHEIARECLLADGKRAEKMTKDQVVREALNTRAATTADFPNILASTANKVLRNSYEQADVTGLVFCNTSSGPDFKTLSRNILSAAEALDEVPEHGEYRYSSASDAKEEYSIVTYGRLFSVTRQAIINDDLGALTRVPAMQGAAAARKLEAAIYAVLTSNSAMFDSIALFHASHSNFIASGSGAAPSETTLNAARVSMRSQTGLQSEILNLSPEFLICPAALETTVDKILNSFGDLADNKSSAVINPFYKKLTPVVSALLDADSSTGWYLACNPKKSIDTIEVAYLNNQDRPYLEQKTGWTVDGIEYKVRFDFGVKALDWRGLYFNYGA